MSRQGTNTGSGIHAPLGCTKTQPGQPGPAPRQTPPTSNVMEAAIQVFEAVLAQSRTVNHLAETLQQQSTQGHAMQGLTDEAKQEKKLLKIRDNVLASTVESYNPRRPGEWIASVQKLLNTHGFVWLEDSGEEQLTEPDVTPQLRAMLDSAVTLMAEKASTIDAKVGLGVHHK